MCIPLFSFVSLSSHLCSTLFYSALLRVYASWKKTRSSAMYITVDNTAGSEHSREISDRAQQSTCAQHRRQIAEQHIACSEIYSMQSTADRAYSAAMQIAQQSTCTASSSRKKQRSTADRSRAGLCRASSAVRKCVQLALCSAVLFCCSRCCSNSLL